MSSPIKSFKENESQSDDELASHLSNSIDGYYGNTIIKKQLCIENTSTIPFSYGQNYLSGQYQNKESESEIYNIMNDQNSSINKDSDDETPMTEIRKKPKKVFKITKSKKKIFIIIKKRKHTKTDYDNGTKRIVIKVIRNLTKYIQLEINNFRKIRKTKYESELIVPALTPHLKKKRIEKAKFLNQIIKDYYYDEKHRLNEKRPAVSNEVIIKDILNLEENDKKITIKRLNLLFNTKFSIFLDCFLNNKTHVNIENEIFDLNNFITFKDCFNNKDDLYKEDEKEKLKNHITSLMNLKIEEKND